MIKSKQAVTTTYSNINYHIICKLIIAKKKKTVFQCFYTYEFSKQYTYSNLNICVTSNTAVHGNSFYRGKTLNSIALLAVI